MTLTWGPNSPSVLILMTAAAMDTYTAKEELQQTAPRLRERIVQRQQAEVRQKISRAVAQGLPDGSGCFLSGQCTRYCVCGPQRPEGPRYGASLTFGLSLDTGRSP